MGERGRRRLRKGLLTTLVLTGVLVGTVVAMMWAYQRQLIYPADTSSVPPAARAIDGARDVTLRTSDGLELGAWYVPAPPATDTGMVVLVAPGNGGTREGRVGLAEELRSRGLAVLLMDYRGYGGNPGTPTEDGLAADADAAVRALQALGHPPERTLYFGESLGTGVVAALQSRHPPAGVVLRSPFTSLTDVGAHHYPAFLVRALLRDRYPIVEHLATSEVPVTVIYGGRDAAVPPALSARVADSAPSLAERLVFEGAGHNDPVMFGDRVADAVERLALRVR